MTAKWEWDREYHIARSGSAFYIINENGEAIDGPFHRVELAHISFSNSDHIKGYGEDGMEMLTKDGFEYSFPTNLNMDINIGDGD